MGAIAPMVNYVQVRLHAVETVGIVQSDNMGVKLRNATNKELVWAISSNGINLFLASMFNSLPNTSFSQNVGMKFPL